MNEKPTPADWMPLTAKKLAERGTSDEMSDHREREREGNANRLPAGAPRRPRTKWAWMGAELVTLGRRGFPAVPRHAVSPEQLFYHYIKEMCARGKKSGAAKISDNLDSYSTDELRFLVRLMWASLPPGSMKIPALPNGADFIRDDYSNFDSQRTL